MVDTALVALVRTGRVRVHPPGQLATVDLARRHPVEAAVLDAVGPIGHRSVDTIRWRLADDDRLLDVGRRLQREGLLGHTHRLVPHLSGGRSSPAPTHEGRRVLRGLEAELPADVVAAGTDAMLVALVRHRAAPRSIAPRRHLRGGTDGLALRSRQPQLEPRGGRTRRPHWPPSRDTRSFTATATRSSPRAVGPRPACPPPGDPDDDEPRPALDLYDVAFLAGGAHRVVDTALVALVESGRIRVHAPGGSPPTRAPSSGRCRAAGHRSRHRRWRCTWRDPAHG